MAAGRCGIPRLTLHPTLCVHPSLVLLTLVLLAANIKWAPISTGCTRGPTLLTINLATSTSQVDHMLDRSGEMWSLFNTTTLIILIATVIQAQSWDGSST